MITVGYMMIYFLQGLLPWITHSLKPHSPRQTEIGRQKQNVTNETLCKNCPRQLLEYMNVVTSLDFYKCPDYRFLRRLIREAAAEARVDLRDNVYDWTPLIKKERAEQDRAQEESLFQSFQDVLHVRQLAQSVETTRMSPLRQTAMPRTHSKNKSALQ